MIRRRSVNPYGSTLEGFEAPTFAPPNEPIDEVVPPTPPPSAPVPPPAPPPTPPPVAPRYNTRLMEGDATKLGSADQRLKSPKYAFLQLAQSGKYDYTQLGDMLKELQGNADTGRFFNGWTVDRDKFKWGGQGQLAAEWDGVDEVDAVGGFNSGSPQGFRWGTSSPATRAAEAAGGGHGGYDPGHGSGHGGGHNAGGGGHSPTPSYTPAPTPVGRRAPTPPPDGLPVEPGPGGPAPGDKVTPESKASMEQIKAILAGMFPGGAFNQGIVDRRMDNVRGALEGQKKSRTATNRAALANRGLTGSGPEASAMGSLESDLYDKYASATSGIYADESENADRRTMQALQLAAGLSEGDANRAIEMFRANTDRTRTGNDMTLGLGQLDLGNKRADQDFTIGNRNADNTGRRNDQDFALGNRNVDLGYRRAGNDFSLGSGQLGLDGRRVTNDWNMGLANYGLARDRQKSDQSNMTFDQWWKTMQLKLKGNDNSRDGYI